MVIAVIAALVLGAVVLQIAIGTSRESAYGDAVGALQATWQQDVARGVPASSLAPLQAELGAADAPGWWSTDWWLNGPQGQLDDLSGRTQQVWDETVTNARNNANAVAGEAQQLMASSRTAVPASFAAGVPGWSAQIATASTPAQLAQLIAGYRSALDDARTAVRAAQAQAVAPTVDATLTSAGAAGAEVDRIGNDMKPLEWDVEQAVVEGTPNSAAFSAWFGMLQRAYQAAQTGPALDAVRAQQAALRSTVDAETAANACGHAVPPGKVLVMSLSAQEMVAYQDGCAVRATPVTTGRPQLPTPTGDFHVFYKTTPFTMVSPWPRSSPFWYPTTQVRWVLEFNAGGYFIHDADWEPTNDYGPGGQSNLDAASHGCVHVPTPTMRWLYGWATLGTPVIVQP